MPSQRRFKNRRLWQSVCVRVRCMAKTIRQRTFCKSSWKPPFLLRLTIAWLGARRRLLSTGRVNMSPYWAGPKRQNTTEIRHVGLHYITNYSNRTARCSRRVAAQWRHCGHAPLQWYHSSIESQLSIYLPSSIRDSNPYLWSCNSTLRERLYVNAQQQYNNIYSNAYYSP